MHAPVERPGALTIQLMTTVYRGVLEYSYLGLHELSGVVGRSGYKKYILRYVRSTM